MGWTFGAGVKYMVCFLAVEVVVRETQERGCVACRI